MAQFRGTIQGSRGEASGLGTKRSGLQVECNGWETGIRVEAVYNGTTGQDVFYVFLTGGSHSSGAERFIGRFTREHLDNDELVPDMI